MLHTNKTPAKKKTGPNFYAFFARSECPSENPLSNTKAFYTISKSSSSSSSSITLPPAAIVPRLSLPGSRIPLSRAKRARFLGLVLLSWLAGRIALREGCGCGGGGFSIVWPRSGLPIRFVFGFGRRRPCFFAPPQPRASVPAEEMAAVPKWRLRSLAGERRMAVALLPRRPSSEAEGFSKTVFSCEERVEDVVVVVVVCRARR